MVRIERAFSPFHVRDSAARRFNAPRNSRPSFSADAGDHALDQVTTTHCSNLRRMDDRLEAAHSADVSRRGSPGFGVTGWRRAVSASIVVLLLVQAGLAGQFLYRDSGLVSVHRVVAEFLPMLSLTLLVLSWLQIKDGVMLARGEFAVSLAVFVLVVAQTGLGFIGRSQPGIAAIHIPLGVLIFGFATQNAVAIWARRRNAG